MMERAESRESSLNPLLSKVSRLGDCEVCGEVLAKYTCPACQVKTCSLPCVEIHKKELDCSGIRNRVKFKHLNDFTDMDLHSDYSLLEEMSRSVERVSKTRKTFQKNLAFKWQKLKHHLLNRGTHLYLLPPKFSKHLHNTSYLDWNTGIVYWKIEWLFPQSVGSFEPLFDDRADETVLLQELLEKHISENKSCERLKPYFDDAGNDMETKLLMKAERASGPAKYLLLNKSLSLNENLQGKVIIEHPTFLVVLTSELHSYRIISPESIEVRRRVEDRRRGRKRRGDEVRSSLTTGSMSFFSDQLSDSDSD